MQQNFLSEIYDGKYSLADSDAVKWCCNVILKFYTAFIFSSRITN